MDRENLLSDDWELMILITNRFADYAPAGMKSSLSRYDWEIIFDGRWKPFEEIPPSAPFSIEYYRTQPLSMRRLEDGIEIVWDEGTLQSAPSITGPWQDVASGGTVRRLFRSSLPAEFFRVKP